MADTLTFELVSPERLLASEPAEMVVLPGADGDFGVLPLHAPFSSLLRPGVITTWQGNNVDKRIFIAGGFAEVNEKACTVLAESAEQVAEIDRARADQLLKDAREDLAEAKDRTETEQNRLSQAVAVAEARVEAVTQGSTGTH